MKLKVSLVGIMIFVSIGSQAWAKVKPYSWLSQKSLKKAIAQIKSKKVRKISSHSGEVDLSMMSDEYKKIMTTLLGTGTKKGLMTKDALHWALERWDKNYDQLKNNDAKFLVANLTLLKAFRGITYRMIPMVKSPKITHSMLRTQVRKVASNLNVYLPEPQWEAGFRYVTEPYGVKGKSVSQFQSTRKKAAVEFFQNYLWQDVYPKFQKAVHRIGELDFSQKPMIWDNQLIFGLSTFQDALPHYRYRYIGEESRQATLAALHRGMEYLSVMTAVNLKGTLNLTKEIGSLYGIDTIRLTVDGVPSKKIHDVIRSKENKNLFTLKTDRLNRIRNTAYGHYRESIYRTRLALEEARHSGSSAFVLIDPVRIQPFDDNIERQLKLIEALISGGDNAGSNPQAIRSPITGEIFTFDLQRMYSEPPKDLKVFLPTPNGYEEGKKILKDERIGSGHYPNYFWGTPKGWNLAWWNRYFKRVVDGGKVVDVTNKDIPVLVRTMRQSFGADFVGKAFSVFVK